jgi:hypothetical protein
VALSKDEKDIFLPVSQTKLTVRKLGPYDYVFTGHIPDTFAAWTELEKKARAEGKPLKAEVQDFKPREVEYLAKCCERAVVKVHQSKATDPIVRLVGKQPQECAQNEVSFFSLKAGDVDVLLEAVFGDEKEAAEVPAAFFRP